MLTFLHVGTTKNEKRVIRRKAERIIVRKGEVFFKKKGGEQVSYTVNLHAYLP